MATLSQQMAGFIASDIGGRLTPEVHDLVASAFLDTAGCILSGREEPVTRLMQAWLDRHVRPAEEASVLFSERRAAAVAAAALNAVAGHALDFDDVALAGHPSVVLVPALLAEAERSRISGRAVVQAYVKGYQVWADLLNRLPDPLHEKGWHPTAVLGTMGVAAAVCAARSVAPEVTVNALGIAASQASGLVANFGTMTKPMHAGWAVEKGMAAVELAALGMTASADALDGRTGLLTALSAAQEPDRSRPFSGMETLAIDTVRPSIKKYPVCYASHRVIDGVLDLRTKHAVDPAAVRAIDAYISPTNVAVLKYARPATPLEAKFSMQFACACALVFGEVSPYRLSAESLADPQVRRIMELVRVHPVDAQCPLEPSFAYADRVVLHLDSGTACDSGDIRFARGHARLPLAPAQIETKVLECVPPGERELAAGVIARVRRMLSE